MSVVGCWSSKLNKIWSVLQVLAVRYYETAKSCLVRNPRKPSNIKVKVKIKSKENKFTFIECLFNPSQNPKSEALFNLFLIDEGWAVGTLLKVMQLVNVRAVMSLHPDYLNLASFLLDHSALHQKVPLFSLLIQNYMCVCALVHTLIPRHLEILILKAFWIIFIVFIFHLYIRDKTLKKKKWKKDCRRTKEKR